MPILFDMNSLILFSIKGKTPVRIGIFDDKGENIYCPKFDSSLPTSMIDIYTDDHHLDIYEQAFINVALKYYYEDYINKSILLKVEKEMNNLLNSKTKKR